MQKHQERGTQGDDHQRHREQLLAGQELQRRRHAGVIEPCARANHRGAEVFVGDAAVLVDLHAHHHRQSIDLGV